MTQNLLVIDLEATCWAEDGEKQRNESEIIEIGIAKLYLPNLEIKNKWTYIVKPERSGVSEFCTQLTSITQDMVDEGISLREAIEDLIHNHDSKRCLWASYGNYDRTMFEKECKSKRVEYPFGPSHVNIKDLVRFSAGKNMGLAKALDYFGIEMEGRHHRGVDDAHNTAKIVQELFKRMRDA